MEEENTIEYFQTTLELLKDKGEVKFMLTSTFVLYDFFFFCHEKENPNVLLKQSWHIGQGTFSVFWMKGIY